MVDEFIEISIRIIFILIYGFNTTIIVKVESRWGVPADSTIEKGDTLTVETSQVSNEEAAGE